MGAAAVFVSNVGSSSVASHLYIPDCFLDMLINITLFLFDMVSYDKLNLSSILVILINQFTFIV